MWFLRFFGLKTGIRFAHFCTFWFGIGYGFRGKNAVQEHICRFNSKLMNKEEKEIFAYSLT